MASFKKTTAAKAKIAAAEAKAMDAILDGAAPHDVMMLCAHALAAVSPLCCDEHEAEFKAEFLRMLGECIAMQEEREADEADESGDAPAQVH